VHLVKRSVVVKSTLGTRCKDDLTCTQITRRKKSEIRVWQYAAQTSSALPNSLIDLPSPHPFRDDHVYLAPRRKTELHKDLHKRDVRSDIHMVFSDMHTSTDHHRGSRTAKEN
jgi:hypothetical protein